VTLNALYSNSWESAWKGGSARCMRIHMTFAARAAAISFYKSQRRYARF